MSSNKMMNMIAFCLLAKVGSVQKASQVLQMHPTSITRAVKMLQQELGYTLLSYEGEFIRLTAFGKEYYAHYQHVVDICIDMAMDDLSDYTSNNAKSYVEIVVPSGIVLYLTQILQPIFVDTENILKIRSYPHHRVYDDPASVERQLLDADFAVIPSVYSSRTTSSVFNVISEYSTYLHWAAHRDYLQRRPFERDSFDGHQLYIPESLLWDYNLTQSLRKSYIQNIVILLENYIQGYECIQMSGIGLVYLADVAPKLRSGEIVLLPQSPVIQGFQVLKRLRPRKGRGDLLDHDVTHKLKTKIHELLEVQSALRREFEI